MSEREREMWETRQILPSLKLENIHNPYIMFLSNMWNTQNYRMYLFVLTCQEMFRVLQQGLEKPKVQLPYLGQQG